MRIADRSAGGSRSARNFGIRGYLRIHLVNEQFSVLNYHILNSSFSVTNNNLRTTDVVTDDSREWWLRRTTCCIAHLTTVVHSHSPCTVTYLIIYGEKSRPEHDPNWIRLCDVLPTGSRYWWRHFRLGVKTNGGYVVVNSEVASSSSFRYTPPPKKKNNNNLMTAEAAADMDESIKWKRIRAFPTNEAGCLPIAGKCQ